METGLKRQTIDRFPSRGDAAKVHLEINQISDYRHGFRRRGSAKINLLINAIQDLAGGLNSGGQIDAYC